MLSIIKQLKDTLITTQFVTKYYTMIYNCSGLRIIHFRIFTQNAIKDTKMYYSATAQVYDI